MRRPLLIVAAAILLAASFALPARAQVEALCFPETGQCIGGQIRLFWEQNGGLAVFGYPIGPEQETQIQGQPVQSQWFERFRIELHPENQPPFNVLLGRVGAERLAQEGRDWATAFPRSEPQPGCRYFPETGHNVCGPLLAYWQRNGLRFYGQPGVASDESLGLWGLPLSDLSTETLADGRQYQVQWFERARLELHPENQPPFDVLGGLLGSELQAAGAPAPTAAPAPQPAPTPAPTPAPAPCNNVPRGSREATRQGIRVYTGGFDYRSTIKGVDAGQGFRYLTFNAGVFNEFYRRADGSPARIFAQPGDFHLEDGQGRSFAADTTTAKLGDRFVGGQVRPGEVRSGRLAFQVPDDFVPVKLIFRPDGFPKVEVQMQWPCP